MRMRCALVALPLALTLAGCGAADKSDGVAGANSTAATPAASPSAPVDRREAELKFAECMRERGVDVPDPGPGGGISIKSGKGAEQKVAKAQQACKHFMDAAVGDGGKQGIDQKELDALVKFAQCMRDHGIDMKDPAPDGRVDIDIPQGTPQQKVEAAQQACKQFAPGGFPA
ncbi:hypothetical protein ACQP1V_02690 [Microtetraspora malaysiensis]|uniref:hypothetical protein n=1 Tax=Microtetraspora malaysiensis TaxID=161358 RepID=UPI003D8B7670